MLKAAVLLDNVQVLKVGPKVTVGAQVTRELIPQGDPVAGLVQSVTLENAVDGRVTQVFSIKVPQGTSIEAGDAVRVEACLMEPDLVGQVLLVDTISQNGLAMIRKGYASKFTEVNQEGK